MAMDYRIAAHTAPGHTRLSIPTPVQAVDAQADDDYPRMFSDAKDRIAKREGLPVDGWVRTIPWFARTQTARPSVHIVSVRNMALSGGAS
jgi:hypothetical protein